MNKQNNQNNKPGFRPTPTQVADSLKILTGVKTNSTIRDLEEEEGELEEKEGVVVSIQTDKINGTGWTVKDDKGELYKGLGTEGIFILGIATEPDKDGKVTIMIK